MAPICGAIFLGSRALVRERSKDDDEARTNPVDDAGEHAPERRPGLFVTCKACGYHMEVNADAGPDHVRSAYAVRKVRRAWRYGHSELE